MEEATIAYIALRNASLPKDKSLDGTSPTAYDAVLGGTTTEATTFLEVTEMATTLSSELDRLLTIADNRKETVWLVNSSEPWIWYSSRLYT